MKNGLAILMVAPQPFFSARGTPFSVLHRIRALLELGHTVDLITYGYGEDITMDGLTIYRSKKLPGVNTIKIGPSLAKVALDILLYQETKRALKRKCYDVFHSHEEAAFFALMLKKKYPIPHLYDMHSSLPHQLSNFKSYNLGLFRKVFEKLEHKVLSNCDGVITICDDLGKIVEQGYADKPHKMIENIGDDRKIFQPNDTDWAVKLNINDQPVLLYTGTFEAYQGIDLFLDALPQVLTEHPDVIALLVGGRQNQVAYYKEYADSLGISDNVRFTGMVHPSNIPNLIDMSHVIVSPRSRGTNTPLKIYNYMRTGKPLVATDRLTHTQILNHDVACLVAPEKQSFADGINKVLKDDVYARELSRSAQQFAQTHFADEQYIKMVGDVYQAMLHPPSMEPSSMASVANV